ncbi:MAG: hypothetical protein GF411_16385 [Candidatus Lokiarchaeota archaeon]|nr:hypothetical protein [Candidatus Lokiarchaeota archaeon]
MSKSKGLEKVRDLLETLSIRRHPFLEKCAETKVLAMTDFDLAIHEYRSLANQAIFNKQFQQQIQGMKIVSIDEIQGYLEQESFGDNLLTALKSLKQEYVRSILQPAVRTYLSRNSGEPSDIESLYEYALNIDGLIEIVEFLARIR